MSSAAICSMVPEEHKERPFLVLVLSDQPPLPHLTKPFCQLFGDAGHELWWFPHLTKEFNFPSVCTVIYICTKFPDLVVFSLAHFAQMHLTGNFVAEERKESHQEVLW